MNQRLLLLTLAASLASCGPAGGSTEGTSSEAAHGGAATAGGEAPPEGAMFGGSLADGARPEAPDPSALPAEDTARVNVPIDGAAARGAQAPAVTVVVFSDFQCPFCGRLEPTLARLLESHPEDVRVVFQHFPLPFHDHAHLAAEAAEVARDLGGDEAFWRMHDLMFQNQRALSREDLLRYAAAAQLDPQEMDRRLEDGATRERVDAAVRLGTRLGVRGTPMAFINGRPLIGAQPFEAFEAVVREELALAQQEASQGVARDGLYARRVQHGLDSAPRDPPVARQPRPDPPDVVYRVPVTDAQPVRGRAEALVTMVMFSDFQCPFCERVEPTLNALRERYGDELRIVWRNNPLPFHQHAAAAATLALEARAQGGDAAFWRAHDLLFEDRTWVTDGDLSAIARQLGVNARKLRRATESGRYDAVIEADQALARQLGASGTPSFFINGRNLRGAQPLDAFVAAVDRAMVEARAELEHGTARGEVYEALTREGATSPPPSQQRPAAARPGPDPDRVYELAVPADAPSRGPADAPVVIQEFADFQCPFCARVGPTLAQLRQRYEGRVRFVWRNYPLPFHQNAMPAAVAAMEVYRQAGDDAFWAYHDLLFAHQRELSEDNLVEWASQIRGVNAGAVRRALREQPGASASIRADMDAVAAAGARIGTPSFFINGRLVQGAQPVEVFRRAIDRALEEASGR